MKTRSYSIILTETEAELILEALDTCREIYLQSASDAVADGSDEIAMALGDAADRMCACHARVYRGRQVSPIQ